MKKQSTFLIESFLFCLILVLGVLNAVRLSRFIEVEQITPTSISFWHFIIYFALATLFIVFISFSGKKFKKSKKVLFNTFFILAVAWGSLITFSLWVPDIIALLLIALLIFFWVKKPRVIFHNLAMIFGLAGIGSVLGLAISPLIIILLLVVFSIYDVIAVYVTKHMVRMAKEMIEAGAILALIVPQKIADFKTNLSEVKTGGKFLILGGGDVVFPLLLCASLATTSILNSLIVGFFALLGLFFGFWFFINQKVQKPIPALPPIAAFSIIGYLITLAI